MAAPSPGQWLITMAYNGESLGTPAAQTTVQRQLPKSNFIARFGGTLRITGTTLTGLSIDRVKLLLNSSQALLDGRGGAVLRGAQRYEQGSAKNGTQTSTTDRAFPFQYQCGRYLRDTKVIISAKLYRSVDLQLTFTPAGATITAVTLDVWVEELVADHDPSKKLHKRLLMIEAFTPVASQVHNVDITPGGLLRALYIWTATLGNLGAAGPATGTAGAGNVNPITLIGNGNDIPLAIRPDCIDAMMVNTYRQDDGAVPTGLVNDDAVATGSQVLYKLDFDLDDSMARCLDTNRLNRLQLQYTPSSSVSGEVDIYQEDVVPVIL